MAEAGFKDGFKLTVHGPAGRYSNDTRILEAIAQMLSRVGIETTVETMPASVFFKRFSRGGPNKTPEFTVAMSGYANGSGEPSHPLRILSTPSKRTVATDLATATVIAMPRWTN